MDILDPSALPDRFASVETLDDFLTRPSQALVDDLATVDGDLLILGVAGKMGPTLARLAKRATPTRRVIGVARFSDPTVRDQLGGAGIETIACDLLDRAAIAALPTVPNVVFAAGHKFGASGDAGAHLGDEHARAGAGRRALRASRIVAFSTGNVYGFSPASAMRARANRRRRRRSASTRSRASAASACSSIFSARHGTPGRIVRLNYAIDMRYGVLFDIASKVQRRRADRRDDGPRQRDLAGRRERAGAALPRTLHDADDADQRHRAGDDLGALACQRSSRRASASRRASSARKPDRAALRHDSRPSRCSAIRSFRSAACSTGSPTGSRAGGASLGKPTKFEVRDGEF